MAQAETKSITRRAFVRAASAVTAAVGTGAAVAVAAPPAASDAEILAAARIYREAYEHACSFVDAQGRPKIKLSHPMDMAGPEWQAREDASIARYDAERRLCRIALGLS